MQIYNAKTIRIEEKIARCMMYARKSAFSVEFIKLSAMIAIIVLKLCLEYKRLQINSKKVLEKKKHHFSKIVMTLILKK